MTYYNVKYFDLKLNAREHKIFADSAQEAVDMTRELEDAEEVLSVWRYEANWN